MIDIRDEGEHEIWWQIRLEIQLFGWTLGPSRVHLFF